MLKKVRHDGCPIDCPIDCQYDFECVYHNRKGRAVEYIGKSQLFRREMG